MHPAVVLGDARALVEMGLPVFGVPPVQVGVGPQQGDDLGPVPQESGKHVGGRFRDRRQPQLGAVELDPDTGGARRLKCPRRTHIRRSQPGRAETPSSGSLGSSSASGGKGVSHPGVGGFWVARSLEPLSSVAFSSFWVARI